MDRDNFLSQLKSHYIYEKVKNGNEKQRFQILGMGIGMKKSVPKILGLVMGIENNVPN